MEAIENMIFGAFLAVFRGLNADGCDRANETLMVLANDPDACPEEARFFRYLAEETAPDACTEDETDESPPARPRFQLITGGAA